VLERVVVGLVERAPVLGVDDGERLPPASPVAIRIALSVFPDPVPPASRISSGTFERTASRNSKVMERAPGRSARERPSMRADATTSARRAARR
jgi:hypothetical protein